MPLKGFKSLLSEKFRSSERKSARRYIHLDGTPIETTGVWRDLCRPLMQAAIVSPLFSTTAMALCIPGNLRPLNIATNFAVGVLIPVSWSKIVANSYSPPNGLIPVIDKSGHLGSMPDQIEPLVHAYKSYAFLTSMTALASFGTGTAIFSDMYYKRSAVSIMNNIVTSFALSDGLYFLSAAVLSMYAQRQLSKGEWTLSTPPSSSRKPEPEKAGAAAEAPTRAFGAAFRKTRLQPA